MIRPPRRARTPSGTLPKCPGSLIIDRFESVHWPAEFATIKNEFGSPASPRTASEASLTKWPHGFVGWPRSEAHRQAEQDEMHGVDPIEEPLHPTERKAHSAGKMRQRERAQRRRQGPDSTESRVLQ